jgi:hypothetical protein
MVTDPAGDGPAVPGAVQVAVEPVEHPAASTPTNDRTTAPASNRWGKVALVAENTTPSCQQRGHLTASARIGLAGWRWNV